LLSREFANSNNSSKEQGNEDVVDEEGDLTYNNFMFLIIVEKRTLSFVIQGEAV
jgi:hypothetical protein